MYEITCDQKSMKETNSVDRAVAIAKEWYAHGYTNVQVKNSVTDEVWYY